MITVENKEDLERIQKCALKIILENKYEDYSTALKIMELATLGKPHHKKKRKSSDNVTRGGGTPCH